MEPTKKQAWYAVILCGKVLNSTLSQDLQTCRGQYGRVMEAAKTLELVGTTPKIVRIEEVE